MRFWDAELQTGSSAPVRDGLLFWLDGRDTLVGDAEYGYSTPPIYSQSHMFDRISGARVDFSRGSATSGGMQQEGHKLLKAAAPYGGGGQVGTIPTVAGVCAVELTFGYLTSGYTAAEGTVFGESRLFFPVRSSTQGAKVEASDVLYRTSVHLVFQGDLTTGKPVIYQNGVQASVTGTSAAVLQPFSVTTLIQIPAGVSIVSIRLYGRNLSEAEIQHNIAYEIGTGRLTI